MAEAPGEVRHRRLGQTATDACTSWLLAGGVDADAIWVRPRDPWMLNRAVIQPETDGLPRVAYSARRRAASLEDMFLRLEDAGIILRIDRSVTPTMAKTPTLATWELERLRTIERVVRHGHIASVERGRIAFADASVAIADDALVVHCAGEGLRYPPLVPVWRPEAITPADPVGLPVLRRGARRVRRGDPRRRRGEEPAVPADALRRFARRVGAHDRHGRSRLEVPRAGARHHGLGVHGRAEPDAHPTRAGGVAEVEVLDRLRADQGGGLDRLAQLAA